MGAIAIHGKLGEFGGAHRKTDFGALSPTEQRSWDEQRVRYFAEPVVPRIFAAYHNANRLWTATGRLAPKNGRMRVVCRYIGP